MFFERGGPLPGTVNRRYPRSRRPGRRRATAGLVVALLGAVLLAWTLGPVGPSRGTPGPAAPPPSSDRGLAPAASRPDGVAATVLATISTTNGTTRPGNWEYSGGLSPANVTAWENRVFVIGEYSGNLVILNASSGAVISSPGFFVCPTASAIDPVTGTLFVADPCQGALFELDPESGAFVGKLSLPAYPVAVAFDPIHGLLVVACDPTPNDQAANGTLLFVNPGTGSVVGRQAIGANPQSLAIDPASNMVYVGNAYSGTVSVVSTVTYALLGTISLGGVVAISFDPQNGDVYLGSPDLGVVAAYNGSSMTLVTDVHVLTSVFSLDLTYDAESGDIAVAEFNSATPIQLILPTNNTIHGNLTSVAEAPSNLAYSAATNRFFVTYEQTNDVASYNATTGAFGTYASLGTNPQQSAFDPTNGLLYVANDEADNLTVISTATDRVVGSVGVEFPPYAVVYDPADGLIYATNPSEAALNVINPALGALVGMIPVGQQPLSIVYDPVDQDLFVPCEETNNISVVSGTTGALLRTIGLGVHDLPFWSAVDPTTGTVWIASVITGSSARGSVTPIDPTTFATGTPLPLGAEPVSLAYDPGSGDLVVSESGYVPNYDLWTVVLSPTTGAILENFTSGVSLVGPADWDASAAFLAIPNYSTGQLEGLFGSPGTLLPLATVGAGPWSTTVDAASGTVYVSNVWGSSVSAVSVASVPSIVQFATRPASCGAIVLNGTAETSAISVPFGIYPVRAPSCYGYFFQGWSTSGGVTVADAASAATNVTIASNGTLVATFGLTVGATFAVGIGVLPSACAGAVELAGSAWSQGDAVPLAPGTYPILAEACSGESFQAWETSGGVSIASQGPDGGILTVEGNGTVNASYLPSPASSAPSSGSSGYSSTELVAFVLAGVLGGLLVGVLVGVVLSGRRSRPPPAPPPAEPPTGPG
jgi:YVTN family beta-propeller protein